MFCFKNVLGNKMLSPNRLALYKIFCNNRMMGHIRSVLVIVRIQPDFQLLQTKLDLLVFFQI